MTPQEHHTIVMKAFQDSMNRMVKISMRKMFKQVPIEVLHEWGLITKTTLTRDGIKEDEGGIQIIC